MMAAAVRHPPRGSRCATLAVRHPDFSILSGVNVLEIRYISLFLARVGIR
jgi:hypothetical protein